MIYFLTYLLILYSGYTSFIISIVYVLFFLQLMNPYAGRVLDRLPEVSINLVICLIRSCCGDELLGKRRFH